MNGLVATLARILVVPALSILVGCGGSNGAGSVDASTGSDAGTSDSGMSVDSGQPGQDAAVRLDASTPDDAGPQTDAGAAAVVKLDLVLAGHPHQIDVYAGAAPRRAVVFLHGGLGTKEGAATQLGLRLEGATVTYDTAWLAAHDVAVIIPMGQTNFSARTWTNYVMDSGADDVAFLVDLAAALRAGTLDAGLPALQRLALSGHSNGGMMVNRIWCEAPSAFEAYVSFAGPASVHLGVGADHACTPAETRPYLGVVGGKDTVLQTGGHWLDDVWSISPLLAGGQGFVDPDLVNELTFHKTVRVPRTCAGETVSPTFRGGEFTTWSNCGASIQLVRLTSADHCLADVGGASCALSIEAAAGRRPLDMVADFLAEQSP